MKSHVSVAVVVCLLTTWVLGTCLLAQDPTPPPAAKQATDSSDTAEQKIRHVVLLKFKPDATAESIKEVEQAFASLANSIDEIAELEWGTNNSPEKHDKGFTHCFLLTFNSAADRDAYLPHPEHKKFGGILGPHLADVLVVDYTPAE